MAARVRGVDLRGAEAVRLAELLDDGLGARELVVGEDHVLEERAPLRDRPDGRPHAARTDDEDSHDTNRTRCRLRSFSPETTGNDVLMGLRTSVWGR